MQKLVMMKLVLAAGVATMGAGCTATVTGVRAVGADLPAGPLRLECELYDDSLAKMGKRMEQFYVRGWRVAFAVERDRYNSFFGTGTSKSYVCYVPPATR